MKKVVIILSLFFLPFLSVFINHKIDFYSPVVTGVKSLILNKKDFNGKKEFADVSNKQLYDNLKLNDENTIVIATFGQSNSANYGKGTKSLKTRVYQYFDGKIYDGSSPSLGASGGGTLCGLILEKNLV